MQLSDNAKVTILLCSYLAINNNDVLPLSTKEWNELVDSIIKSNIKEPSNLLGLSVADIERELNIDTSFAERIYKLLSKAINLASVLERYEQVGIYVVTRSDKKYPIKLKKRLKRKAPQVLFYCGNIDLANTKGISVVGSRHIDNSIENYTSVLAEKAAKENLTVFSGGAKGVDSISQQTALKHNGTVVSVVSDSLLKKVRMQENINAIINDKLLLISAVNPDAGFTVANAMSRNKYIYTLSDYAFVISSDYNKGGTWFGATENIRNNWVKTFVWDNKLTKGNSELIKKGAIPISNNYSLSELLEQHNNTDETKINEPSNPVQLDLFVNEGSSTYLTDSNLKKDEPKTNIEQKKIETESKEQINSNIKDDDKTDVVDVDDEIEKILTFLEEPKSKKKFYRILIYLQKKLQTILNNGLESKVLEKVKKTKYVKKKQNELF